MWAGEGKTAKGGMSGLGGTREHRMKKVPASGDNVWARMARERQSWMDPWNPGCQGRKASQNLLWLLECS